MQNHIGRRRPPILIVEDDYFIAEDVADQLFQRGASIVGPVGNIADAVGTVRSVPSLYAAVLDINLHGEMAYPVADALMERNIPFVFATGYDAGAIPQQYASVSRCGKPVDYQNLARMLHM